MFEHINKTFFEIINNDQQLPQQIVMRLLTCLVTVNPNIQSSEHKKIYLKTNFPNNSEINLLQKLDIQTNQRFMLILRIILKKLRATQPNYLLRQAPSDQGALPHGARAGERRRTMVGIST